MSKADIDKENIPMNDFNLDVLKKFSISDATAVDEQEKIVSLFFDNPSLSKLDNENYKIIVEFLMNAIKHLQSFRDTLFNSDKRDFLLNLITKHSSLSQELTLNLIVSISHANPRISIFALIEFLKVNSSSVKPNPFIYEIILNISKSFKSAEIEFNLFYQFFLAVVASKIQDIEQCMEIFHDSLKTFTPQTSGANDDKLLQSIPQFLPSLYVCPKVVVRVLEELERIFKMNFFNGPHMESLSHFIKCFFKPEIHAKVSCFDDDCFLNELFLLFMKHTDTYYDVINPEGSKIFDVLFSTIRIPPVCSKASIGRLKMWWMLLRKMPIDILIRFPNRYFTPFMANLLGKYISLTEAPVAGQIFKYKLGLSNVLNDNPYANSLCHSLFLNLSNSAEAKDLPKDMKLFHDNESRSTYLRNNYRVCMNSYFTYLGIKENLQVLNMLPELFKSFLTAFLGSGPGNAEEVKEETAKNLQIITDHILSQLKTLLESQSDDSKSTFSKDVFNNIFKEFIIIFESNKNYFNENSPSMTNFRELIREFPEAMDKFEGLTKPEPSNETPEEALVRTCKSRLHEIVTSPENANLIKIHEAIVNHLKEVEASEKASPEKSFEVEVLVKDTIDTLLSLMRAYERRMSTDKTILNLVIGEDESQASQIISLHNLSNVTFLILSPCFFSPLILEDNLTEIKQSIKDLFISVRSEINLLIQIELNDWLEAITRAIADRLKFLEDSQSQRCFELILFQLKVVSQSYEGNENKDQHSFIKSIVNSCEAIYRKLDESAKNSVTPKKVRKSRLSAAPLSAPGKRSSRLSLKAKDDKENGEEDKDEEFKKPKRVFRKRGLFPDDDDDDKNDTKSSETRKSKRIKSELTTQPPIDCDENALFVEITPRETTMTPKQREKLREHKKDAYIPLTMMNMESQDSNSMSTQDDLKVAKIVTSSERSSFISEDSQSNNSQAWHEMMSRNKERLNQDHPVEPAPLPNTEVEEAPKDQVEEDNIMCIPETQEEDLPKEGEIPDVSIPETMDLVEVEPLEKNTKTSPLESNSTTATLNEQTTPERPFEFKEEQLQTTPKAVLNSIPKCGPLIFKGNMSRSKRMLDLALNMNKNKKPAKAGEDQQLSMMNHSFDSIPSLDYPKKPIQRSSSLTDAQENDLDSITEGKQVSEELKAQNNTVIGILKGIASSSLKHNKRVSFSAKNDYRLIDEELLLPPIDPIDQDASSLNEKKQLLNKRKPASPQRHPLAINEAPTENRAQRRNSLNRSSSRLVEKAEPILNISINDDEVGTTRANEPDLPLTSDSLVNNKAKTIFKGPDVNLTDPTKYLNDIEATLVKAKNSLSKEDLNMFLLRVHSIASKFL